MASESKLVTDSETLREVVGKVFPIARDKVFPSLDKFSRQFLELSPFLCLGTISDRGFCDVSPRGDPPGFVKIIDDKTIAIPERPGNRLADSMHNILSNRTVGIIAFVPGISESLRFGGKASVVRDEKLLAEMRVRGQLPKLAIKVDIEYVFFHCAKALIRSKLWDPDTQVDRDIFPPYGEIIQQQRRPDMAADEVERLVQDDYKNSLY
ncbi:MSMEG_1061 family FMN-dependent PPOX-type flavoprotein [Elongatibacter sediminis]|uniref:MSMEG_1061 family FMN-dependent PPOX-type flavoprotein n=1 Tax=Elongatibacter sediminis TaxID=3119006 RepID=A0AAW9RK44_9GAMM